MNNSGKVTVFFSLISGVLAILAMTSINVIQLYSAKGRVAMGGKTIASCVRAEYNDYIYENYHILLFDKTCGGRGEAFREEQLIKLLQENLGEAYSVEDIAISYTRIVDNDCQELKKQIHEYMPYAVVEYGVNQILESTGGRDGSLDENTEANLKEVVDEMSDSEESDEITDGDASNTYNGTSEKESKIGVVSPMIGTAAMAIPFTEIFLNRYDPRDFTKNKTSYGLLLLVLPEDENPSRELINIDGVPSEYYYQIPGQRIYSVDTSFEDMKEFSDDIHRHASWMDSLLEAGEGVVYARKVFNCLTSQNVNEATVFQYELEYLIEGKCNDWSNISNVVKDIIEIRLPVNYAYLITDKARMSEIMGISVPLAEVSKLPERVIRYLIAGCWSYIEAIAEVRSLLHGNRLSFFKNDENWITDIYDIRESIYDGGKDDDNGLCYEDYLMILMSTRMDLVYYRMLDLMELNARQSDESFRGVNAATALVADIAVTYKNYDCSCEIKTGY